ncbi:hypothetical protein [Cyanobacterium sp. uoEpiScrs1]|nr:hypothetical protein [Cyanobacterium sp. uoEpiScrs1]
MSCLIKFVLASTVVFCIADLIPFPDLPSGMIVYMISQYQQQNQHK